MLSVFGPLGQGLAEIDRTWANGGQTMSNNVTPVPDSFGDKIPDKSSSTRLIENPPEASEVENPAVLPSGFIDKESRSTGYSTGDSNSTSSDPSSDVSDGSSSGGDVQASQPTSSSSGSTSSSSGSTGPSSARPSDNKPPTITAPPNVIAEAKGALTNVSLGTPTVGDLVDRSPVVSRAPSGNSFPVGLTTVTWMATDASSNYATAIQTVTITDKTKPVVTVSANIVAEATGPTGAKVSYSGASAVDLVDGSITPKCNAPSNSTFRLGSTIVICSATDKSGNTGTAKFSINVRDTTPPTVIAPHDVTMETKGALTTISLGTPSVIDLVDPSPLVVNNALASFPVGKTIIAWKATDAAGNTAVSYQSVTLVKAKEGSSTIPANGRMGNTATLTPVSLFIPRLNSSYLDVINKHLGSNDYGLNFRISNLGMYPEEHRILLVSSIANISSAINVARASSVPIEYIGYDNEANNDDLSTPSNEIADPAKYTNMAADLVHAAGFKFAALPTHFILLQELSGVDWTKVDFVLIQVQKVADQPKLMTIVKDVSTHVRQTSPHTQIFAQFNPSYQGVDQIASAVKLVRPYITGVGIVIIFATPATLDELLTALGR